MTYWFLSDGMLKAKLNYLDGSQPLRPLYTGGAGSLLWALFCGAGC
jgi:hypothetical protein